MQTKPLRGSIGSPDISHLVLDLQGRSATGRLRAERDGVRRDLYLRDGVVVCADSSADTDALEWLLFTAGALSEERLTDVRRLIGSGSRRGPALVEAGGITPAGLCEWAERRACFLARDTMTWRAGEYAFEEAAGPDPGAITVRLDPREVVMAALRESAAWAMLSSRLPAPDEVPQPLSCCVSLLPHEVYVLSLADGRRKVSEICWLSEIGEADTLRTLALLATAGCLAPAGGAAPAREDGAGRKEAQAGVFDAPPDLPPGDSPAELRAAVRIYNELYVFLCAHMIKEVGPIAEQLLDKHMREVRDQHAALFARAAAGRDGSLPEDQLVRNVNAARDQSRRDMLVAGLQDYLRAMVVAVRRILGPDHEAQVVRRLRELRCSRA
ncbi:MAG TPA: DUF4388 domain-containing protein [Candidatus Polarisedimenticolia bacterium]|nr:DUF4388 domain-containing protein [Candidatus Polarisedimenticolia bacterium]